MNESPTAWNFTARALHWLIAALLAIQWLSGWIGHEMDASPARVDMMTFHKSLGLTILMLVVVRLAWRLGHRAPPPPVGTSRWQSRVADLTHAALYFLLAAVPLSGWLAASTYVVPWKFWWVLPLPRLAGPDRALHELAAEFHEGLIAALLLLVGLHVAAALWHHFVRRDDVLVRMWRG